MGRWTPKHYDEVLVSKIENLVNGAIRRCKQDDADEKTKMQLTYESFVESLDEGDTFTTSLIEILVKELADRQSRSSAADKRLIASRTSDSLHSLAVSNGTYRGPPYSRLRNRASANINTAPTSLYDPSDSPEDDDFEDFPAVDSFGGMEGARIDSALYDVYSRPSSGVNGTTRPYPPAPGTRPSEAAAYRPYEPSSIMQRQLPVPHQSHFWTRNSNTPRWASVFPGPSTGGSGNNANGRSLERHPSIRRPNRGSRVPLSGTDIDATHEFANFASRRRSAQRGTANRETAEPEAADGPVIPPPPSSFDVPDTGPSSHLPQARATLFDPPSPPVQSTGTRVSSPSLSIDADGAEAHQAYRSAANTLAFLVNAPSESAGTFLGPRSDLVPPGAPRMPLRRGGVRPPESMLSSGPPSSETTLTSLLRPETDEDSSFHDRDFISWFNNGTSPRAIAPASTDSDPGQAAVSVAPTRDEHEAPTSLPTPRSVSPTEGSGAIAPQQ
ncbi:hypothetical protein DFH11DRAFT_1568646 [Phellopilus nigrolimitatus]|nr:hypothetical protein DFH11DRAFT_1568646 [Phellopilus nigrolimitatus]